MDRRNLILAAILGFLGVAAGAFGAHGLCEQLGPEGLETWRTGVLYHLVHALALLGTAALGDRLSRAARSWAGGLFAAGVVVFSGSLYVLALGGPRWLGAITPIGGTAFLAGWLTLAVASRRAREG